jgi:hypothetical protein
VIRGRSLAVGRPFVATHIDRNVDVVTEARSSDVRACEDELRTAARTSRQTARATRVVQRLSALAEEKVARRRGTFVRGKWGRRLVIERDRALDRFSFDHRHPRERRIPFQGMADCC